MSISDLLVRVDDTEGCTKAIKAAVELAEQFEAHITGLYATPPIYIPVYSGAAIPTIALAEMDERAKERAILARGKFEKLTRTWESKITWLSTEGEIATVINKNAQNHDLIVMGQYSADEEDYASKGVVEKVALESGRPVLVIPQKGVDRSFGKRILVAWNGRREAVRAVHDALPFLKRAESVDIVSLNSPKDIDIPCADIAEHLARHGVRIETEKAHVYKSEVGKQLLSLATTYGADMLVMGAYGHSRFRETILGGATRHILSNMSLPVLMSH